MPRPLRISTAALNASNKATEVVEDQLKAGVEGRRNILGNESEALRMARNELDKLIDEAEGRGRTLVPEALSEKWEEGAKQTAQAGKQPSDKPSSRWPRWEKTWLKGKVNRKPVNKGKGEGQKQSDQPGSKGMAQNQGEPKARRARQRRTSWR